MSRTVLVAGVEIFVAENASGYDGGNRPAGLQGDFIFL